MTFSIAQSCSGCGRCVSICPERAITGETGKAHLIDSRLCIDCGACAIVCADEAILDEHGVPFAIQGLCLGTPLRAVVHEESCTGCGECVKTCPLGAIVRVIAQGRAAFARVLESRCTGCAVCQLECDKGAIEMVCAITGQKPE